MKLIDSFDRFKGSGFNSEGAFCLLTLRPSYLYLQYTMRLIKNVRNQEAVSRSGNLHLHSLGEQFEVKRFLCAVGLI